MRKVPELLVPAGGMEQLKAAVACGADAVYVGGSAFSARANAANFSDDELRKAIGYAHTYGVNVHVALNTLLYDSEIPEAVNFVERIYGYGADAVIVQDIGMADVIHRYFPALPLHLSTQGTICDIDGVRAAERLGAERAILARELSEEEIRKICREKGTMEIEIFVHGAICISLSGQCHLSGVIGGRSGNRGDCAQPCRMRYSIGRKKEEPYANGYMLSPSDMCLLTHLEEIADAGVDSIKIEGRMKSPEYVALVTSVYRKYLDLLAGGEMADKKELAADIRELRQIYSRGPFTDSYFHGTAYTEMLSGKSPKHQGLPVGTMESYNKKKRHARVRFTGELSVGDGAEIRGERASAGNIITYMRDSGGQMVKRASAGMKLDIGDLNEKHGIPEKGAGVYKISDKELGRKIDRLRKDPPQRVPVVFDLDAAPGRPMKLTAYAEAGGHPVSADAQSKKPLETAGKKAADERALAERLEKTGGTPYHCVKTKIHIEGNPFVPAALLNSLRRRTLSALTEKRLEMMKPSMDEFRETLLRSGQYLREHFYDELKRLRKIGNAETPDAGKKNEAASATDGRKRIQLYFYDVPGAGSRIEAYMEAVSAGNAEKEIVFCIPAYFDGKPLTEHLRLLRSLRERKIPAVAVLPPEAGRDASGLHGMIGEMKKLYEERLIQSVLISNAGQAQPVQEAGLPFSGDTQLNVMNRLSGNYWAEKGAQSVCLTEEPEAFRAYSFEKSPPACVSVYGRIPVMYTEHCPIGCHGYNRWNQKPDPAKADPCCGAERKYHYCEKGMWQLTDHTGAVFPVTADSRTCRAVIYSHKVMNRADDIQTMLEKGAHIFRINIFDEKPEDLPEGIQKLL